MYKTKAYSATGATSPLAGTTIARRDPTEHDVQIEILFCGICHSDLHQVRDEWKNVMPTVYPCVPGHEIAARQMRGGFGGMLSLRVRGGAPGALAFIGRLQVWKRATSLGGVESLIEHRASVEGPQSSTPADLLRMSVGLEDTGDLILDLEQALR